MKYFYGFRRLGFHPKPGRLAEEMERTSDERVKQVVIGASILIVLTVVVAGALMGWRLLPGLLGEWVGMMIGIVTTPFFMETSFAILGLAIVMFLNHWRQQKDGDELVYLEQVSGPDVPADLPEHAKWALYREKPLAGEGPSLLAQAEGAFAIGDFPAAAEWIGAMDSDELKSPETLRLRLDLAKSTGRDDLARQLEHEIGLANPDQT
jgi:hypothetical protein